MHSHRMRRMCAECSPLFAERIERRVPAAYLMGRMWFAGPRVRSGRARHRAALAVCRADPRALPAVDRSGMRAQHPRYRHRLGLHRDRLRAGVPVGLGGRGRRFVAGARGGAPQRREARRRRSPAAAAGRRFRARRRATLRPGRVEPAVRQRRRDARPAAGVPARARPRAACRPRRPRRRSAYPRGCQGAPRAVRCARSSKWATATSACERAFPALPLTWLEFEHGGGGVFMVRGSEL